MAGLHESQVRRALLTVRDADVLCEMAVGWRTSIANLDAADDKIRHGIRGLKESDQFGEATREAAVSAFGEMRDYIGVQRLKLAQTARALDAAGGAITQAAATVRRWDRTGDPVPPRRMPAPDPAAVDQTAYLAAVTQHGHQTADYTQALNSREEEARQLMATLERVFHRSEEKIREQHGIVRKEEPEVTEPVWPPADWPGLPPTDPPDPEWPPVPIWPPVDPKDPSKPEPGNDHDHDRGPGPGPGHGPDPGPDRGPGHGSGRDTIHTHPGTGVSTSTSHPHASTSVAGSAQSGVTFAGSGGAQSLVPGSSSIHLPASVAGPGSAGLSGVAGLSGSLGTASSAGATGASTAAGGARMGGARMGGARAGGAGVGAAGRSGAGAKGSQRSATAAKTGRAGAAGGAGGAGGRGSRKKDKRGEGQSDDFTDETRWLEGEDTGPDVLR